jgi:predicted phosphoadenosine phosphosulfate sulfurtransferase
MIDATQDVRRVAPAGADGHGGSFSEFSMDDERFFALRFLSWFLSGKPDQPQLIAKRSDQKDDRFEGVVPERSIAAPLRTA